MLQNI